MMDPVTETVAGVLRENGATAPEVDTDTLATRIVNAVNAEHGRPVDDETAAAGVSATEAANVPDTPPAGLAPGTTEPQAPAATAGNFGGGGGDATATPPANS